MKIIRNFSAFIVSAVLAISIFVLPATAANATIGFNTSSPKVNQTFTVSVTLNPGKPMYGAEYQVKYNASIFQYQSSSLSGSANGGAGIVKAAPVLSGDTRVTHSFTFKTIASGTGYIEISGMVYGADDDIAVSASAPVTVSDASKSSNANLKALSLSNGALSPKFSASRTNYTATVSNSVTECRVYATAEDGTATVSVGGSNSLKVGENVRTVTVTAASGAKKEYKIVITRQAAGSVTSSNNGSSGSSSSNISSTNSSGNTSSGSSSENTSSGNVSSTVSDPEAPVVNPENPYEAVLDGETLTIATDLSAVSIPNGFTSVTVDHNGAAVAVAEDAGKNYTIYYLKSATDTEYTPYILSDDGKSFNKLKYAVFGANTYIIEELPHISRIEDGYYETNIEIGKFHVKAYASEAPEMKDLYYIYCFFNGDFGMYRYDSREQVLQRSPEFKLLPPQGAEADAGLAERFSSLSLNGKVILVGLCVAVLGALALIALLIVKIVRSRKAAEYNDEEDMFGESFDSVETNDDSSEK